MLKCGIWLIMNFMVFYLELFLKKMLMNGVVKLNIGFY